MSTQRIRAFLDTNVLKYAVDERLVFKPRVKLVHWGDVTENVVVHEPTVQYPNLRVRGPAFDETLLLPFIAYLAKRRRLELLLHRETLMEFWGLPSTMDPRGRFYGAPITMVNEPFPYNRVIVGAIPELPLPRLSSTKPMSEAKRRQVAFIASLTHPRLCELRNACNADSDAGINPNQLIDAFHLWSAETSGATHFLTVEKALLALREKSKLALGSRPVMPSELLTDVLPSRIMRAAERIRYAFHRKRHHRQWYVGGF